MTPSPGLRFAVAPHFHLDADWPARLAVGSPWRPVGADDLAALVLDPTAPAAREELSGCVCLFVVPVHLRASFWDLLAEAHEGGAIPAEGYSAFVSSLGSFLAFKQLRPPAGAVFDLVVQRPRQPAPLADLWGLINLGEEAASVVLLSVAGSGYPAVRLRLGPGEGARVPAGALLGSDEGEGEHPDVLLLIRLPQAAV
jgi:hypothetical protein